MKDINWFKVIYLSFFIILVPLTILLNVTFMEMIYVLILFDFLLYAFLIKVYNEVIHKQKVFDAFKKREEINKLDIIELELANKKIKLERKEELLIFRQNKKTVFVSYIKGKGNLHGNINNKEWSFNKKNIPNPFYETKKGILIRNIDINCFVEGVEVLDVGQIVLKIENEDNKI